jgi:hypothetical protein
MPTESQINDDAEYIPNYVLYAVPLIESRMLLVAGTRQIQMHQLIFEQYPSATVRTCVTDHTKHIKLLNYLWVPKRTHTFIDNTNERNLSRGTQHNRLLQQTHSNYAHKGLV